MAVTALFPLKAGKRSVSAALGRTTDYVKNPDKTDGGEWVSAYECDPLTVDAEFAFSKSQYAKITGRNQGSHDVIAYHLRQAFKPGEIDAETANEIGYKLALRLTKGKHAFVCCTHTDRHHLHNHIVFNSTSLDCTRKFRNFKYSYNAIRKISDLLCAEYGLSIVEKPKLSNGRDYGKWLRGTKTKSGRQILCDIIDNFLSVGLTITELFSRLKEAGCEIKTGKRISIKPPQSKKFFRLDKLGDDYSYETILERLSGKRKVNIETAPKQKPNLLIGIQQKIAEGKGAGYEHWAKIFNLKQLSKTLIFLKEKGIDDYDDLVSKSSEMSAQTHELNEKIRGIDSRLKEISELQKQIGTYSKTKEKYQAWRSIKNKNKAEQFYEIPENRADIVLHQAAKKFFEEYIEAHADEIIPSIKSLKQEWAKLKTEKSSLYKDYNKIKVDAKELAVAKQNAEAVLFGQNRENSSQKSVGFERRNLNGFRWKTKAAERSDA
jgi:hypothetical protein